MRLTAHPKAGHRPPPAASRTATTTPVLVLSGATPGLAVVRALGARGVPVSVLRYARRDTAHVSRYVREVLDCPHPEQDETRFVALLAGLRDRYRGAVVVPASDVAAGGLSLAGPELEAMGYLVACPPEKIVQRFLTKTGTAELALAAGVPAPITVALHAEEDIDRYAAVARFPAVLKPAVGHRYKSVFGRKWTQVDSPAAALVTYREAREAGFEVLLQELIPGDEAHEANYLTYRATAQDVVEFTARKIRNSPSHTGSPCVTRSLHIPELVEPGRRILEAAGLLGYACVEFKRDPRDGVYKLIEANVRHNLSESLARRCGIDFPWIQYRHLVHGELPAQREYTDGVYWIDITRDLRSAPSYLWRPGYSVARFVAPYLGPHVFAVLSARDPRPALRRAVDTVGVIRGRG